MIPLSEVLELVGFVPHEACGDQVRGPCPVHRSRSSDSRCFSVNLKRNAYRCFKCGAAGNQLDLYAAVRGLTVFAAAVALCAELGREVPWVERW